MVPACLALELSAAGLILSAALPYWFGNNCRQSRKAERIIACHGK
jgi:hypothetical protein